MPGTALATQVIKSQHAEMFLSIVTFTSQSSKKI